MFSVEHMMSGVVVAVVSRVGVMRVVLRRVGGVWQRRVRPVAVPGGRRVRMRVRVRAVLAELAALHGLRAARRQRTARLLAASSIRHAPPHHRTRTLHYRQSQKLYKSITIINSNAH